MPVKGFRCWLNSTRRIGWQSIEITLYACLVESVELGGFPPNLTRHNLNGFPPNSTTKFDRPNPLRLHCMPVKGFRCWLNLTSQIGWKSIEITLYACLVESVALGGFPPNLTRHNLNGFPPNSTTKFDRPNPLRLHCMPVKGFRCWLNSTSRIGWKSIEITLYACLVKSVKLGRFPPNSTRHNLNGFPPNSTDSTRHNLNGFQPNLTTQFN